jgi:hypothetical protein
MKFVIQFLIAGAIFFGTNFASAQDPFMDRVEATAKTLKWKIEVDPAKRWMLVSGATKDSTEKVVRGLQYAYEQLDLILGEPNPEQLQHWVRPAILFYVPQKKSRQAVVDVIAPAEAPENEEWRKWARKQTLFCYPHQGYAYQKQSAASDAFGRYTVVAAVHAEFARRYGAYPYWLAEGVNMAIQQQSGKRVNAFFAIDSGRTEPASFSDSWPLRAGQACDGDLFVDLWQVAEDGPRPETLAPWFAIGFYASQKARLELRAYLSLYAEKARPGQVLDQAYHAELVQACFGPSAQKRIARFWESGVKLTGTPEDMAAAAAQELEEFASNTGMKSFQSKDQQWKVFVESDLASKNWISIYDKQVEWLAGVLPASGSVLPAVAFVLQDRDTFRAVCDVTAEAAPVNASYYTAAREGSGFSTGAPPLVGIWLQKFADNYDQTHELARQMIEVKLIQKCGSLPPGMLMGLASSVQKLANGDVKAHRIGVGATFIEPPLWDSTARRLVAVGKFSVADHLFAPIAMEFDRDRELLCYAFGKFMLDEKPKQSKNFFKDYLKRLSSEGSVAMTAPALEAMLAKHFGRDWDSDLQKYWSP